MKGMTSLTTSDFDRAADFINTAYGQGLSVTVDGYLVKTWPAGRPAQTWGTGSLSVDVPTKSAGRIRQMWWKVGSSITIEASILP
jgi:hypothetical protein